MKSTARTTFATAALIAVTSMAIGMVVASRFNLTPASSAQRIQTPVNPAPITGGLTATTFREIAETQTGMVVNIRIAARQTQTDLNDFFGGGNEFFRRFFGDPPPQQEPRDEVVRSAGSGFVIDPSGLILTNSHVVENATKIEIDFFGDDERDFYEARVLGRDPLSDSALLELVEKPDWELTSATFGDSSQMAPGDWVMAIGNPFGYGHTLTVGIISATGRGLRPVRGRPVDMLQTDAAINPGNSGGPLLNIRGEVVGVNTAIISDRMGNVGIGFAVPINTVRDLLEQLHDGKVTRGVIGVGIADVPREGYEVLGLDEPNGVAISAVNDGGPADDAGMRPGDVIVAYNGEPVTNTEDLQGRVVATAPGTVVPIEIVRDLERMTLDVTIGELNLDEERTAVMTNDNGEETSEGFGITLQNLTPNLSQQLGVPEGTTGAVVSGVAGGGAAEASDVRQGDVILRINRTEVETASQAIDVLDAIDSGRTAFMLVQRGENRVFLQVEKQ
ncbi:MAG: PDZ domain-containing protein [Acidobacteria bacterium]|nr:PDZ domain-containing protein [Acidobacteriota bacterium]